jgi:hypothetical protein
MKEKENHPLLCAVPDSFFESFLMSLLNRKAEECRFTAKIIKEHNGTIANVAGQVVLAFELMAIEAEGTADAFRRYKYATHHAWNKIAMDAAGVSGRV